MFDNENVMKPQTPAASSDMGRGRQSCFLIQITPWEKALLLRVDRQTSIEDSSDMPQT